MPKGLDIFIKQPMPFVRTPDGAIFNQVRVPWKNFGLFESIYGGHLSSRQTHSEGILRELREELALDDKQESLKNAPQFAAFDVFEDSGK